MKEINGVVSGKGGTGKTTNANHCLPYLTSSSIVVEIDNNNFSSIYSNSQKINGKTVSTKQSDLEKAIDDADFDSFENNIIIDAGGGEDSIKVIKAIKAVGLKVKYWIPLMPDFETIGVLKNTRELIEDAETNLILSNFRNLEEDFWFIFGSEEYGIEPNLSILKHFTNTYQVPNSNLFGIAKTYKTTVWDLALIQSSYSLEKIKKEWREQGREAYHKNMQMHRLSVACNKLLEQIKSSKNQIELNHE